MPAPTRRRLVKIDRLFPLNRLVPSGEPHRHDFHEALFILRGAYEVAIDHQESHLLTNGQAVWYPMGIAHTPRYPDEDGSSEIYCCAWLGPSQRDIPAIVDDRDGALHHYFRQLYLIDSKGYPGARRYALHLLACLEAEFIRLATLPPVGDDIAAVKEHIDRWFMQPLSIDNLCAMFGASRTLLFREFQTVYGISPGAYLRSKRAEKARFLLTTTDLPFDEVASQVGVGGIDQLTRLCKSRYGCGAMALRSAGQP